MRILVVNPSVLAGGAQKILLNLAYHLQRLGHEVLLYTTRVDWSGLPPEFRTLEVVCSRHRILRPGGAMTRYQNVPLPLLAVRLFKLRRELCRLMTDRGIDLVLAHQPPSAWLCSFLKVPVVWNCFEPMALWSSRRPEYFHLRPDESRLVFRVLEEIYEWCDRAIIRFGIPHVFVLSKRLQDQVASLYGKPSDVFYPGSDCHVAAAPHPSAPDQQAPGRNGTFTILQVGQFHANKNHLITLEVAKRLKENGTVGPFRVLFAGEGDLEPFIRQKIADEALHEHVGLLGSFPMNDPRFAAIYQRADVLVFPSTMQSWGLVPFEALANGVVPIVSRDSGAAEIIQEQDIGYVADPTAEDFYHALIHVYTHTEEAKDKVARGRRFVTEELTYARYAEKISARLEELFDKQEGRTHG